MPSLPCPLGIDCRKGPKYGIWQTVNLPFKEAKQLLDDHVKFSHQLAVTEDSSVQIDKVNHALRKIEDKSRKNVEAKSRSSEQHKNFPTLKLWDLNDSISLKYCKNQKEYRCLEDKCSMPEFISLPRFKKHLADKHFVETEMGRNNSEQKPHITRVIPENERGGKFKCDRCLKRFHYKKDLQAHGKRCTVNLADLSKSKTNSPSDPSEAPLSLDQQHQNTGELQPIDLSQMNTMKKVRGESLEASEIRIISSKNELSSSESYSRPQANEVIPTVRQVTPAHDPYNPFSVSTFSTIVPYPCSSGEVRTFDSDKNGWYLFINSLYLL